MLKLALGNYGIAIDVDPTYVIGSADNLNSYNRVHVLGAEGEGGTSRHSIRVTENDRVMSSCILMAAGGTTGIHEHSAIVHRGKCIVAVGPFMVSLGIPMLELDWATKTDWATCFGVYHSEKHGCLISHGELQVARISDDGQIVWEAGGADILTNGISVHDDHIRVIDFNDDEYVIDINNGHTKSF